MEVSNSNKRPSIRFEDLFHGIDPNTLVIDNPIQVPNSFYRELLDCSMERSYLDYVSERKAFPQKIGEMQPFKATWLQITRLPVHPDNTDSYDLFNRWQGVLSSLHAWGYRFLFLLQRREGKTHLYLGAMSSNPNFIASDAIEQVKEASSGSMPGVELRALTDMEAAMEINFPLQGYGCMGAVTGLPSFFSEKEPGVLQTLDSLAFGIRGTQNEDRPYSLLVIADPISDAGTNEIINKMRSIGSEIHSDVDRRVNLNESNSTSGQKGLNPYAAAEVSKMAGTGLGRLMGSLGAGIGTAIAPGFGTAIGQAVGNGAGRLLGSAAGVALGQLNKTTSSSFSLTVDTSYLDKYAQYAEELTEKHIERMKQGRNLGYWNVGVYVLGKNRKDVTTVNGMLRSIYSGRESYLEPIRLHVLNDTSGAMDIVRGGFNMIPLYNASEDGMSEDVEWHVFGRNYQYLSTPMNTKELALTTSLPRRDVPGLRFVKTAVRFANNPPVTDGDTICLGKLVDMGVEQKNEYRIEPDVLVRHALVTGSTGSGKSTSGKRILKGLLEKKIPVLIIEPAKDDYVRWAMEMNRHLPQDMQFRIYMPGHTELNGKELNRLQLNPFEPAAVSGAKVDMTARCENLIALLNASLPTSDILPVLMDETVYNLYRGFYGKEFVNGFPMIQQEKYPTLDLLTKMAQLVMDKKHYEQKVKDNLMACLETRFQYLNRGTRGRLLAVKRSTDYDNLFSRPTVINISGISSAKDKALIMSLLMLSLYEYRKSIYENDAEYRSCADRNKLLHLTLVEEAHNVLMKPETDAGGTGNPQQVVADLFSNMLSEIRSYGEGLMIVDQVPTRLIPDAIKNTNYKIVHRMTAPDDCQVMAASLALREEQKALIPSLPVGHAIVYGDKDDAAAWVHLSL